MSAGVPNWGSGRENVTRLLERKVLTMTCPEVDTGLAAARVDHEASASRLDEARMTLAELQRAAIERHGAKEHWPCSTNATIAAAHEQVSVLARRVSEGARHLTRLEQIAAR